MAAGADVRTALVRYIASDAARSQRWIAPLALYGVLSAIFYSDAGPLLTTYADTIASLFILSIWLTWVIANSEDAIQASITAVAVGGAGRLRRAKLVTAYLCCAALGALATLLPLVLGNHTDAITVGRVAAGAIGHLLAVGAGVAIGSLLFRSVIPRPGWVFLVAVTAALVEIVVPNVPPVRQLLVLFNHDHPHLAGVLAATTAETVVLSAVLIAFALRIARSD